MSAEDTRWFAVPRDVVMVEGADAGTYLHSQLSQDLLDLAVGGSAWSYVLAPTGKVDALVRVTRSGDAAFVLDVDGGTGEALVARLNRFRIRVQAEVTSIPWSMVAVRGPAAAAVTSGGGAVVLPSPWPGEPGVDLLGPSPQPPAGLPQGDLDEYERRRVRAGWPAMGAEVTADRIPGELGLLRLAVSFTKGCYPGQELVERMDSRGATAPRRLRRVVAAGGALAAGAPLWLDGAEVGRVTSAAGDVALALVARSVTPPAEVQVGDAAPVLARVEELPEP